MSTVMAPGIPGSAATSALPLRSVTGNDGQVRGAWLREMENAQIGAWLNHPVPATASHMEMSVRCDNGEFPSGLKMALPSAVAENYPKFQAPASLSVKSPAGLKLQLQDKLQHTRPTQPLVSWQGEVANLGARILFGGNCASDLITPPHFSSGAVSGPAVDTATRTPIRVHVQESPEGLRLWIGLDVREQADIQAIVTNVMARLDNQGIRLARLVCNGRVIFEASCVGDSQENQSPPTQPSYNQES